MPRYRDQFPRPKREYHHGAWRITWRWDNKKYSVTTSIADEGAISTIEAHVRNLSSQLASHIRPKITDPWKRMPGMLRYLDDRYGSPADTSKEISKWLTDYRHEIRGKNTDGWVRDSIAMLKKLRDSANGLDKVTDKFAATYMAEIAAKPPKKRTAKNHRKGSPGTHNRTLTVFKKFYTWLVNTSRYDANPFASIKRLNERKDTPIVYCTLKERDEMIELAKATGWPEWKGVYIAFYTGMRREEVANLLWSDISFDSGTINIRKTKTGKPRTIPLPTAVEKLLESEENRIGHVVTVKKEGDRIGRLNSLINRMKKDRRLNLFAEWGIEVPAPSRSAEFKEKRVTFQDEVAKHKVELETAIEHIGWNVFRHTFASLKVQDGVDVQKVAMWIGDTLDTCLLHYAQFVPKDKRDPDIDRG